tara:strand:+ start:238 stop:357 length:120 start_codon:yes stop_codon:yes gene_type:complete
MEVLAIIELRISFVNFDMAVLLISSPIVLATFEFILMDP